MALLDILSDPTSDPVVKTADITAIGTSIFSYMTQVANWYSTVATLLSAIWVLIRIIQDPGVRSWCARIFRRKSTPKQ